MTRLQIVNANLPKWTEKFSAVRWYANINLKFKKRVLDCGPSNWSKHVLVREANYYFDAQSDERQRAIRKQRNELYEELYGDWIDAFGIRDCFEGA